MLSPPERRLSLTPTFAADLSRSKSTSSSTVKKNTTVPGAAPPAGVAPSRVKATPTPPRPSGTLAMDKKPTSVRPSSSAPRLSRPATNASTPDLKNVRAKVGSTENIKHQPGGGRVGPGTLGSSACWPLLLFLPHPTAVPEACPHINPGAHQRGAVRKWTWHLGRGGPSSGPFLPFGISGAPVLDFGV